MANDQESKAHVGTWLGTPGEAEIRDVTVREGQNAISGAVCFHALRSFGRVSIRMKKPVDQFNAIQLFRLNPQHQMPVPKVKSVNVTY